jgi:hypothetical protein
VQRGASRGGGAFARRTAGASFSSSASSSRCPPPPHPPLSPSPQEIAYGTLLQQIKDEYDGRIAHLESRNSILIAGGAPAPGDDGRAPTADVARENDDLRMEIERLHARVRTLETADAPLSGARSVGVLDAPPHMGGGGGANGSGRARGDGIRVLEEDDISLDGGSSEEEGLDADGSPLRRSQNGSIPTLALGALRKGEAGEEEGSGFHQAFVAEAPNFSDSWREGLEQDQRGASFSPPSSCGSSSSSPSIIGPLLPTSCGHCSAVPLSSLPPTAAHTHHPLPSLNTRPTFRHHCHRRCGRRGVRLAVAGRAGGEQGDSCFPRREGERELSASTARAVLYRLSKLGNLF